MNTHTAHLDMVHLIEQVNKALQIEHWPESLVPSKMPARSSHGAAYMKEEALVTGLRVQHEQINMFLKQAILWLGEEGRDPDCALLRKGQKK